MAELLTFAVEGTLTRLASLAQQEFSLLWGFEKEITSLRESLSMIQALLRGAEQHRDPGEAVGMWVKKLVDIAHDADDVLDDNEYEVRRRKVELQDQMKKKVLDFFSHNNTIAFRLKMAHKIKKINASLRALQTEAPSIGLVARSPLPDATSYDDMVAQRDTISSFGRDEKDKIVGRRELVSEIVTTLIGKSSNNQESNCPSVLSVVGMGGLGKTTLAKSIYNDDQIGRHFNQKIWVFVSTNFDVKMILSKALENLKPEKANIQAKETILQNLREELKGKRYLLILDDVWNEDHNKWDDLMSCLSTVEDTGGSSIIVTTRSGKVSSISHPFYRCDLKRLSTDECWLILKTGAFPDGRATLTEDQKIIGREIAERCGGLPLLTKVLGSTLRSKRLDEWRSIGESRIWDLPEGEERVLRILKLSFDELKPPALKQCFAYCSMLSKGAQIGKDDLIRLWMAQGLLHPTPNMNNREMEEIGEEYFNVLWQNSFLQDVTEVGDGYTICRMHDLVHDLAKFVSKSNDEDSSETRHRLRSVFLKGVDVCNTILPNYIGLRVLVLDGCHIKEFPVSIGKLKHLRYLDFSRTQIKTLPKSIGKLYNLQTLRLSDQIEECPKEVGNLINLRHVYFNASFIQVSIPMVGQMCDLRSLPYFLVGKEKGRGIEELGGLNQLKGRLDILNLQNVRDGEEAKKAKLAEKKNICHLILKWDFIWSRNIEKLKQAEVLEALQPHPNLETLEIEHFMGDKLPSWIMNCCFAALKRLHIVDARNVMEWTEATLPTETSIPITSRLPSLSELEIMGCDELSILPSWLQYTTSLQGLIIHNCPMLSSLPTLHGFVSLRTLNIHRCDRLTSLLNIGVESCAALEELRISKCQKLVTIPSLDTLTNLRTLEISHCPLKTLPSGVAFASFSNLMKLSIGGFSEELESFPAFEVRSSQLQTLQLIGWPKLKSLPEQVQHLTSLTRLTIDSFDGMEALPEWFGILASLKWLEIRYCKNLMYLPSAEAMQRLIKLESIIIVICPHLKERCNKDSGPEWHKIAHVPISHVYEAI